MFKNYISKNEGIVILYFFILGVFLLAFCNLFVNNQELQFEHLAKSFINGHLYLPGNYSDWADASYYKGHVFWLQGFFPAVILLPFVFFGNFFHQGQLQFMLNILNIFLLYKLALKITQNKKTSLWLSFSYIFATAYLAVGLVPWSWWFAQVVATSVLLLSLNEFFHKRRFLIIGICLGCALATRIDLLLGVSFFLLSIVFSKEKFTQKAYNFCCLCIPIALFLFFVLVYNFFRFGSILEFGYTYHIPALIATRQTLKHFGVWNIFYFPTNMYYLFLKGPNGVYLPGTKYLTFPFIAPDIWGMSIFLTSPIFLWCFKTDIKKKFVQSSYITVILLLIFLLGYFGTGARQYGYRYALDFYPFLFIILCYSFRKRMSFVAKTIIMASFIFNVLMLVYIFKPPLN